MTTQPSPETPLKTPPAKAPPLEVIVKDRGDTVGFACSKCGTFFSNNLFFKSKEESAAQAATKAATKCCVHVCKKCNKETRPHHTICDECRRADFDKTQANKVANFRQTATQVNVQDYKGTWVYWEGHGYKDGFFENIDAVYSHCEDEDEELPENVWGCNPTMLSIDAEDVVEGQRILLTCLI